MSTGHEAPLLRLCAAPEPRATPPRPEAGAQPEPRLIDPAVPLVLDEGCAAVGPELLSPPLRQDLRFLLRDRAALLLDRELRKVSRGRSLIDRKLCHFLAALGRPAGYLKLGYVRLEDYGRERLGFSGRYVRELSRLGEKLGELPAVARALERGEVSLSAAREIVRVASKEDEAQWVERAMQGTVRRL